MYSPIPVAPTLALPLLCSHPPPLSTPHLYPHNPCPPTVMPLSIPPHQRPTPPPTHPLPSHPFPSRPSLPSHPTWVPPRQMLTSFVVEVEPKLHEIGPFAVQCERILSSLLIDQGPDSRVFFQATINTLSTLKRYATAAMLVRRTGDAKGGGRGELPAVGDGAPKLHACKSCQRAKTACGHQRPCQRCQRLGLACDGDLHAVKRACVTCKKSKVKCNLDERHPGPCNRFAPRWLLPAMATAWLDPAQHTAPALSSATPLPPLPPLLCTPSHPLLTPPLPMPPALRRCARLSIGCIPCMPSRKRGMDPDDDVGLVDNGPPHPAGDGGLPMPK